MTLPTEQYAAPAGSANEVAAALRQHVLRVERRDGKSYISQTGKAGLAVINGSATAVLALGDADPLVHALHGASTALGNSTWKPSARQTDLLGSIGRNMETADQLVTPERFTKLLVAAGQQDAFAHLATATRKPDTETDALRAKLSDVIKAHRGAQAREDELRTMNGELREAAARQAQETAKLRDQLHSVTFCDDEPEVTRAVVEAQVNEVDHALEVLVQEDNNTVRAAARLAEEGHAISDRLLRKWRQRYADRYQELKAACPAQDAGDRQAEQAAEAASKLDRERREGGLTTALAEIRESVNA